MTYEEFLESKIIKAPISGFSISESDINSALLPHQRDAVLWAINGGRRAVFASFGLGKTVVQLEFCHQCVKKFGGKALIVMPLGVRQEFTNDAVNILGYEAPVYVTNMAEIAAQSDGKILLTNYERVRDGDIDPTVFAAVSLDEAAVLRSFGSKTYQTFLPKFRGVKYKMVATATPAPNKLKELIHYAGFLEILDTGQALTRFFQRDSTKANNLTLYPHKVEEFWLWVSTWALFISKPSDLGYDDTGYDLPPMEVRTHVLRDEYGVNTDKDGQFKLMNDAAVNLQEASREKAQTIKRRCALAKEIVDSDPQAHFILWHDREEERHELKRIMPEIVDIYGSMDYDEREKRVNDFSYGKTRIFATKKSLSGVGCNFQRYCHRAIFIGIDYQFHDFIQACMRVYRFLQTEKVIIDIIYTEAEEPIYMALMEKWKLHDEQQEKMREIVQEYGLSGRAQIERLKRGMGVSRTEVRGKNYLAVNEDCVLETARMAENSVDMILTSVPFSNHYEYTPNYSDFGHNDDTKRFFEQMDYLSPNLLRVLKPGRVFCCHVKDRVLFGNATGTGMPTMEPFHALCIEHYMKHGFQYFGMITIVTDVVRENNQTYRLGWTEQCKDGTKMGVGCPEYVLLFRKLPTDTSTAYADEPVSKTKEEYTRAQWQLDAHGFWRDGGNRLLTKDELLKMPIDRLQAAYRKYSRDTVYDYQEHMEMCKKLDADGHLPATFMVMAPGSWNDSVWDDINRMRTLNSEQKRRDLQLHVCLAEGSLILTRRGYVPIEQVEVGDMVLTHKGNWKPVIAKACTGEKETVQTKAQGVAHLLTTPDHKFWARTAGTRPSEPKRGMVKAEPEWIEARNLNGCYVNAKLPAEEETDLTHEQWWIVGRYLADGHVGTRGDYFVSVGKCKQHEFELCAGEYAGTRADRGSCFQYRLKGLPENMKTMLAKCGRGAENKQVPVEGLCLPKDYAESLLCGYLSGDGNTTGNETSATSVSRGLLLGIAMLVQRVHGKTPSIFAGKSGGKNMIEGREVNTKQEWVLSWRDGKHCRNVMLDDGAWKRVKHIVPTGVRTVWSIRVADDASYTAEGCIVKNCPLQIETVERLINRYSNKGDLVFDPFGGIGTVPYIALKMGRRGMMTELNGDYFRDAVGYLKAYEEDIEQPTFFDFVEDQMQKKEGA